MLRTIFILGLFAMVACPRPQPKPTPPQRTGAPHSAATAREGSRAPTAEPAPANAPRDPKLRDDVQLLLGGNFSVDHIGPQAYEALWARIRAAPSLYVDQILQMHRRLGLEPTTGARWLCSNHAVGALVQLHALVPDAVEGAAGQLLPMYEALPAKPPDADDSGWATRRAERVAGLVRLAGGVDRAFDPDWPRVGADQICLAGASTVAVRQTCTCGPRLACKAEANREATRNDVKIDLRIDPQFPGTVCRDCYPAWTSCTVSGLDLAKPIRFTVAGQAPRTVSPAPGRRLSAEACTAL